MPLQAPNLDDRKFADIVSEARALIPRYAPEWTNFNETDPGVTLVELFAWMTEILMYRVNQVPDRNYIKFLQLLGIELDAARPAHTELTFIAARPDLSSVIVPQGTQVAADGPDGKPIIFETDESLIAIGALLDAVQTFDGVGYTVQTKKNGNEGQWFYPFGQNPRNGSALMLGFSSPVDFPDVEINLAVQLFESVLTRPLVHCIGAIPPPARLAWECWNGTQWIPINLNGDGTRAFTQEGHILLPPFGKKVVAAKLGATAGKFYWVRARIETQEYEMSPRVAAIRTNTIPVTQALTFRDEVLGGSDGTPNQIFRVSNLPVMALNPPLRITSADGSRANVTSVQLEIDEGAGFIAWQEVEDFFGAGPDDRVFTFDRNTGAVTTGSGEHGRIPVINPANLTANVVARFYRSGGGSAANVGAGTITQIQTAVPGIGSAINYDAASGGTDEESVVEAKERATQALKSKERAVTAEDFAYLARRAPGANVKRVLALPLVHPNFPNGQIPGVVTVIVVPNSENPKPMPNTATLQAVCAYLDQHRLLTSEVYVIGPVYRKIKIEAQLIVKPGLDLAVVRNTALDSLENFFHPVHGGNEGTGWPFGGEIYYSDVYRRILQVEGVLRIQDNQMLMWLDDQPQQFCRDVPINPGELLFNDPMGHDIKASYTSP